MEAKKFAIIFNYNLKKGIKVYAIPYNTKGSVLKICVESNKKQKILEDKYTNKTINEAIINKHEEIYKFLKKEK